MTPEEIERVAREGREVGKAVAKLVRHVGGEMNPISECGHDHWRVVAECAALRAQLRERDRRIAKARRFLRAMEKTYMKLGNGMQDEVRCRDCADWFAQGAEHLAAPRKKAKR